MKRHAYFISVICITILHTLVPYAGGLQAAAAEYANAADTDDYSAMTDAEYGIAGDIPAMVPAAPAGMQAVSNDGHTLTIRIPLPESPVWIVILCAGTAVLISWTVYRRRKGIGPAGDNGDSRVPRAGGNGRPSAKVHDTEEVGGRAADADARSAVAAGPCTVSAENGAAENSDMSADTASNGHTSLSGHDLDMIKRLDEFLAAQMHNVDLSVDDMATAVCMSRSSLFRRMKSLYGMNPNEYLRQKRLSLAADLLLQNRYTVSDVCLLVGFNSPSYFSSCFKKQYNVLPKDYRVR